MQCIANNSTGSYVEMSKTCNFNFTVCFIRREKSLYKVGMYRDVVSTTKNVQLSNMISRIIFAGALTIFTGALPPGPHTDDGAAVHPSVRSVCFARGPSVCPSVRREASGHAIHASTWRVGISACYSSIEFVRCVCS